MNRKHINSQLCKVFKEFTESVEDLEIRSILENGTIITGGALVSLLTNVPVNDYDMYFRDFETCYKVANYFVEKFNKGRKETKAKIKLELEGVEQPVTYEVAFKESLNGAKPRIKIFIQSEGVAGEMDEPQDEELNQTNIESDSNLEEIKEEKPKYIPKFLSSNAISLSGKVQLVIRFYGEPEQIHENYDFVHCTNYWTSWDKKVSLKQEALEAIINKELRYIGSKYPLCSIIRTRKFIQRGWTINAGQYLKMAMQLNELDLKNIKVLEDQLVGVDSHYFAMLINSLQSKMETDSNFSVDNNYAASIIDKIF